MLGKVIKKGIKIKSRQLTAGVLAVIMMVTTYAQHMPDVTYAAVRREEQILPVGGLMDVIVETVEDVDTPEAGSAYSLQSISVRSALTKDDWDCYGTDYYYSKLSAEEQRFYERLDAACAELLVSPGLDARMHTVNGTKRAGTELVSGQGLDWDRMQKVAELFIYSNPQYYFLNCMCYANSGRSSFAFGIYDAFKKGSTRARETKKVLARLQELREQVVDRGVTYETEAQIHALLCQELTYMEGEGVLDDASDPYYTQTVYGALTTGNTVCAGYAKLYTMLCNSFGIDCVPVTSTSHAWNEVRYGDHWYIVDVTWNDRAWDQAQFFHLTDQQMRAKDQKGAHVPYSYYDGMRPVADTVFSGNLMLLPGLTKPQVRVTDTASGVRIEMTSDGGDIYYTLDGTTPGANDRYTGPVELTKGGSYTVTAMASAEGVISSAYVIVPVRIAGGKVRIASAKTVSGKKIRIKLKAEQDYPGYEVSCSTKKNFSSQTTVRFSRDQVSDKNITISSLKSGKTYYIRVRGYREDAYGKLFYTPYSTVKKVVVR